MISHFFQSFLILKKALALVEEETRRYRPTKNYLDHLPTPNMQAYEVSVMLQYK